ncbi:hypothetical protein SERLA73DRAFT_133731 [Serpula lacrymans var. lacrymans S7.3]|uniref:Uncharacterized protein n=1 Tax=Serpula lacrymans var. lacrymans (strain S7.3) TaxID=936435 RepID=F8PSA8_SERL3|nr:hypothetical protein SERLA73DRAFT_133731 [Serpula lacrymans var. lacrymans S7.3]
MTICIGGPTTGYNRKHRYTEDRQPVQVTIDDQARREVADRNRLAVYQGEIRYYRQTGI